MRDDTAVATDERELLAGFRLRTAAMARNFAWITLGGVVLLAAPHHSPGDFDTHGLVWLLVAMAAGGNLMTYSPILGRFVGDTRSEWPFHAWTLLLLMFDMGIVFLSHDARYQVYLIYLPVLLFAAATMKPLASTGAFLLAVATSLTALAVNSELSAEVGVASVTSFTVVWLLGSYLSREQRREITETARQRAEAEQRGRELALVHQKAMSLNNELQSTVAKVITAQEEERRRIGRELHDEAVQSLSAAAIRLNDVERRLTPRQRLRAELTEVRDLLADTLWEVRKIIVDLRPSDLDHLGLVPALYACARQRLQESGVEVEMRVQGRARRLPPQAETALFRIGQEAINNVARHARAQRAVVALDQSNGLLVLEVEDDGVGFDVFGIQTDGQARGLGLLGMRERAALLGGRLLVESIPGAGTRVRATIPLGEAVES